MRFFSNEAKETDDEHENDADRTEGTTVPQQRSGSPWSDTPGSASDSSDDVVSSDNSDLNGSDALRTDDSEVRHDGDDLVRDDDSPRSGDHDDLDLPLDGRTTTDEDRSGDELAAGSHRADDDVDTTDAPVGATEGADATEGSVHDSTMTTYGPDGSVTTNDEPVTTDDAVAEPLSADTTDDSVAEPLSADTTGDVDRTDDERDVDEATPVVATAPVETTTSFDDATVADTTPVDAPVDDTVAADDTATDADAAPAVAAVPVDATATPAAAKPDPSANPVGDKLFTDGDSFNERLRDITFNFVDDPKDATAQAAGLVDEAIDKVTSALKAQKDALAAEGDDTEKLRVELRGYRDILQRLTAL